MVQLVGYHATSADNRDSILATGLEARKPSEHNYHFLEDQPQGVYVIMNDDKSYWWDACGIDDYYRVVYCGPAIPDPILGEGYGGGVAVLLHSVPPNNVTLIDYNDWRTT